MKLVTRKISTSKTEVRDLLKAWIVISAVFAIVFAKNIFSIQFLIVFGSSAITAGLGFLLHELAHKVVAQKYGCHAEFRSQDSMLLLAVILSFMGFIFAAPGAVYIHGHVSRKANGKISAAGPLTNIVLAVIFLGLTFINNDILFTIARFGLMINAWLAIFNMIPIWVFDGRKVWDWSKPVWIVVVVLAGVLLFL